MSNTRHFTVKGEISCLFQSTLKHLAGLEVQLWHKGPIESILLGSGITDNLGIYNITFSSESPVSYIENGKIQNVFLKVFSNGVELSLPPIYDSDANAYFEQLVPQPSLKFKEAINNFVLQLKTDGSWAELDRFYIFATEHQQHATISLKNPSSVPVIEVNSPAWTINSGYTFNGTTNYLRSGYAPATDGVKYTLNSCSFGMYSKTSAATANSMEAGTAGAGGKASYLRVRQTGNLFGFRLNEQAGAQNTGPNVDGKGLFIVKRTAPNIVGGYRDGVQLASGNNNSDALSSKEFYVGCNNNNGVAASFSNREISCFFLGSGHINPGAIHTAFLEFGTAIGFDF